MGEEIESGRRRWPVVVAVAVVVVTVLVVIQQVGLRDLRELEQAYMEGRQPTACSTQELIPYAFGENADEIDEVIEELVVKASAEVDEVHERFRAAGEVMPFPPLRGAQRAIDDALEAQSELYRLMVHEPEESEEQLRVLGAANNRAERRLARVRRWFLVGEPERWDRRFVCREPAPTAPPER